jgi:hypothetical protein
MEHNIGLFKLRLSYTLNVSAFHQAISKQCQYKKNQFISLYVTLNDFSFDMA